MSAFAHPLLLSLALLTPAALGWLTVVRRRNLRVPGLAVRRRRGAAFDLPVALALGGLAAAWFAAAGPRTATLRATRTVGRDLVVLLDLSASMGGGPTPRDTLEAAREAVGRLAAARRADRLALVAFGGKSVVLAPLTLDHATLLALASTLTPATFGSETAIGDAIAVALDLLRDTPRGSGGVVLVTDGENNAGAVDPNTASEVARDRGVRVSTVAVGDDASGAAGRAGEELLRQIARRTGGEFVRARDHAALDAAFERLAELQPAVLPSPSRWAWNDRSATPAALAALLLVGAAALEVVSRRAWA